MKALDSASPPPVALRDTACNWLGRVRDPSDIPDAWRALLEAGDRYGDDRRNLVAALGVPQHEETETRPNIFVDGAVDTVRTLSFRDWRFEIYIEGYSGRAMLSRSVLKGTAEKIWNGIGVGSRSREVTEGLGPPCRVMRTDNAVVFLYPWPELAPHEPVAIRLVNDRVVSVEWEYYVD